MHFIKALIPIAGIGTYMLPIVDKPLTQYIVNECVNAGIKEIVLVTHFSKNAIENDFDTSFELEARVKRQLLDEVKLFVRKT